MSTHMSILKHIVRTSLSLILAVVLLGTTPEIVAAQSAAGNVGDEANPGLGLSAEQKEIFSRQIFFYDVDIAQACAGLGGSKLVGSDNIEMAYNFFIGKGLTREQAAGILGNLRQESNVTPTAQQDGSHDKMPKDGVGFGIAQWTFSSRQDPLVALAKKQKKEVTDLALQLDYMWGELNGSHKEALEGLKGVKLAAGDSSGRDAVHDATFIFHKIYEGSADTTSMVEHRVDLAFEVYTNKKYTANSNEAVGQAKSGGATTCGGVLVDGYSFPLAPQTKRNYTNLPCTGRKSKSYTDIYGHSASVPACHHDYTPAYDLMYEGVSNQSVYAITDSKVIRVNHSYSMIPSASGSPCNSLQIQADAKTDPIQHYYWYGHILLDPNIKEGMSLKAGDLVGKVAPTSYGARCWGGGPHLHIDRGCVKNPSASDAKDAEPHTGGNDNCRDPTFLPDLKKIWDGLPAPTAGN